MISITLTHNDWGQICDCLRIRMEEYEQAAAYHEGEPVDGPIADATDAAEANNMASIYRNLIEAIQRGLTEERKGPQSHTATDHTSTP
jgi:hypothetical protein